MLGVDFIKPDFHTCVNTTAQRRLLMYGHQCFETIPACAHMKVALVELFRGDARFVSRCAVTAAYRKPRTPYIEMIFCLRQKRAMPKNDFITTSFRKSLIITQYQMRYSIYIPLNVKDLTIGLTMLAYEIRQRNKVCTNKQL